MSIEEKPKEASKKKTSRVPSTDEKPEEASKKNAKTPSGEKPEEGSSKNDQMTKKSSAPATSVASENSTVTGSQRNSRRSSYASSSGDGAEGAMSKEKLLVGKISFDEKKFDKSGSEPTADNDIKELPVESLANKTLTLLKRGATECAIDFKEMSKKFMEVSKDTEKSSNTAPTGDVKPKNEELIVLCVKKNVDTKTFTVIKNFKGSLAPGISIKKPAIKKITPELMGEPECIDLEPDAPPSLVATTTEPRASSPVPSSSSPTPSTSNADPPKSTKAPAPAVENLSKFMETKLLHIVKSSLVASGEQKIADKNVLSEKSDKLLETPASTKVDTPLIKIAAKKAAEKDCNDESLFLKTLKQLSIISNKGKVELLETPALTKVDTPLIKIAAKKAAEKDYKDDYLFMKTVKQLSIISNKGKVDSDKKLVRTAAKKVAENSIKVETKISELKKQEAAADDSISKLLSEIPSLVVNKILITNPMEPIPPQSAESTTNTEATTSTTTKTDNPLPKSRRSSIEVAPKKAKKKEAKEKAALTKAALKLKEEKKTTRKKVSRNDSSGSEEVLVKRVLRARPNKKQGRKKNKVVRELRSSVSQETIIPKRERKIPSRFLIFEEVGGKRQHASSESGREDLTDSTKKGQPKAKKRKTREEFAGKKYKSAVTEALSAVISKNHKDESGKDKKAQSSKAQTSKQKEAAAVLLDKIQAEYAVSALYNYRQNEDQQTPIEEDPEPEAPAELKTKMKPPETKGVGRGRRKRHKQIINKGANKWSEEKLNFYQNRRKRGKLVGTMAERELLRLGHVIINMDSKLSVSAAKEAEDTPTCSKDFCKMGCVCKSLEVPMREEFHCGKAECIFQCICVNAGASNCFFDSRVQDKTRNLAPEQKEFTNTVISSGSGAENLVVAERGKRERKVPTRLQVKI
jgi:Domain of unknown function (DUF4801)